MRYSYFLWKTLKVIWHELFRISYLAITSSILVWADDILEIVSIPQILMILKRYNFEGRREKSVIFEKEVACLCPGIPMNMIWEPIE